MNCRIEVQSGHQAIIKNCSGAERRLPQQTWPIKWMRMHWTIVPPLSKWSTKLVAACSPDAQSLVLVLYWYCVGKLLHPHGFVWIYLQIDIQWVLAGSVRIPSSYRLKMFEIACQLARKVTKLPLHLCRVVFHQGTWFMIVNIPEFSSIKQTKNAKEMTCLCRKQDDLPVKMGARWHAMEGPTPRGAESERQGVNRGGGEMCRPLDGRQAKTHQTPIFVVWDMKTSL